MTAPAPSGGSSPLRIGGLALIGVGAVAALIGVASLVGGGGGSSDTTTAAGDPAVTSAATAPLTTAAAVPATTAPATGTAPTSAGAAVALPQFGSTATGGAVAPSTKVPGAAAAAAPKAAKSAVRVYNNSTITGLAARAAGDFRASGWPVDAVANYPQGTISTSTVFYRPGTAEESAATSLAGTFGLRAQPRFQGLDEATPGLIVIVTNDFKGK